MSDWDLDRYDDISNWPWKWRIEYRIGQIRWKLEDGWDWIMDKLRALGKKIKSLRLPKRRKVHDIDQCYKCGRDDLPMRWDIERVGYFTLEEGWLCVKCLGDSDRVIKELYMPLVAKHEK